MTVSDSQAQIMRRRSYALMAVLIVAGLAAASSRLAAEPAQSPSQDASEPQASTAVDDAQNNGYDFTRPENSVELRSRFRSSSGTDSQTDREIEYLRLTGRIKLDPDWKLAWFAQAQFLNKSTISYDPASSTSDAGLGDSTFQAALIRTLNERWAFGFGSRLVAPTAQDDLGSGKWEIMPGLGVRYSLTEWGSDSYFVPVVRYAMSFAGDPSRRNISEPQIAPTLNISLPDRWFLTLYPSNDIRINYGDPVSGQTGRLFLPADFAIGLNLTDKVLLSLEIGVPIIKDYPVYDFKTEFRVVIKN